MEIKFYTTLINIDQNIINVTNNYFHNAILEMHLAFPEFEKIIIADNEYLEKAINEIKPNSRFTNDEYFVVGGKSFSIDSKNGHKFSLLFNTSTFAGILADIPQGSDKELYVLQKFGNSLVFHELAHCLDNKFRIKVEEYKIHNEDKLFKIQTVSKYYISILIDEIAACYLSALKIDNDVFNYEMNSSNESFQNLINEKVTLCKNYSGNTDDLYELAFRIAGIFWLIFIQSGKLIGWKVGNKALQNIKIEFSSIHDYHSNIILNQFEELIQKLWFTYPDIHIENISNELISLWKNLALSMGIKFIESEKGDGIFW